MPEPLDPEYLREMYLEAGWTPKEIDDFFNPPPPLPLTVARVRRAADLYEQADAVLYGHGLDEPLSEKAAIALEILLELPPHRGLTGPKLLEALAARGVASDQSTLTRWIVPALKPYGIAHKPKIGYFIPVNKRPVK